MGKKNYIGPGDILKDKLNLSDEEWTALCNYGHPDTFNPDAQTVEQWQRQEKNVVMELSEHYDSNDYGLISNVLNREI